MREPRAAKEGGGGSDSIPRGTPLTQVSGGSDAEGRLRGLAVLVVDDQLYICDLLTSRLRLEGAVATHALSAREALAIVNMLSPTLVITDIAMPDADGVWLLERIRQLRPDTVVVAMSGFFDPKMARIAGFDAYIAKPFMFDELSTTIATALATRDQRTA